MDTIPRANVAARMGDWSAQHRWRAILLWLVFVVVTGVAGGSAGTVLLEPHEDENGESRRAQEVLASAGFPESSGEMVLIESGAAGVTVDDPEFRRVVEDVAAAVGSVDHTTAVRTPYDGENPAPATEDGRTALVIFDLTGTPAEGVERVAPVLAAVGEVQDDHPGFSVEQAGEASAVRSFGAALGEDFQRAEALALPITAVILLIAFGTLLPVLVPITLSMTAFFAAAGLLALSSHLLHVDQATTNLMLLIGLAVGVDYSLFYVRRVREERGAGRSREMALHIAAATSGRAVLISGITVVVAMAGMFVTGNGVFMGFALGTILVVATAVVGSVTVLPAVLALLGDRIDARLVHGVVRVATGGRVTWPSRRLRPSSTDSRFWNATLGVVLRRPLLSALLSAGALLALAVPALDLRTGQPGLDDLQGDFPVVTTLDRIEEAFPGASDAAVVVVRAPDVESAEMRDAIEDFRQAAFATGRADEPFGVTVNPAGTVATLTIGIAGDVPGDEESRAAVESLRGTVLPATLGTVAGAEFYVTGGAAGTIDFNEQLRRTGPLVFAFVLGLAFVLLLLSFRSVVLALKSILLNLLSVAAAYGILVLVFQRGYGTEFLGVTPTGTIVNWLPLFLFVILFGLSTDYHVFIISRIREAYDGGMPAEQAVAHGITATAKVVTSAALIMVAVFAVFGTMSLLSFVQMGVGLAAAILIDATVVRVVLLPATMKLLGEWNWYLPRWLEWLPGGKPPAVPVEPAIVLPPERSLSH